MNNEIFDCLVRKITKNIEEIGNNNGDYPETADGNYFKNNGLKLSHIFNWTQSFHTGMAYWAYRLGGNEKLLDWLKNQKEEYRAKVFDTPMETMHDLGFLYTPYAVALYKLTGDDEMKTIALKAADELAKRFIPNGGYIRAWGRMDDKIPDYVLPKLAEDVFFKSGNGRAIIDCMMNIPLLFWASKTTGHPFYQNIAAANADTVLKYFVREDYSVCHAFLFDTETGEIKEESNSCGYANGSHWARGTSWAVYGFAIAYSYTKKEKYLNASVRLFEKFIDECNGEMPIWDFRLPKTEEQNIDTSAVAVMLCASVEILKHTKNAKIADFAEKYDKMIMEYADFDMHNNGLLREQNGRHVYTAFGDYYFTEYLCIKYKNMERIW